MDQKCENSQFLSHAIHSFAVNLYQLSKQQAGSSENIVTSPISVFTALLMISTGARGSTLDQVMKTLNLSIDDASWQEKIVGILQDFQKISESKRNRALVEICKALFPSLGFQDSGDHVIRRMGQAIMTNKSFPAREEYAKILADVFTTVLKEADFTDPEVARLKLNQHVSNLTSGIIQEALPEDSIWTGTTATLFCTFHFKGTWWTSFYEQSTFYAPFFLDSQHAVQMPFMCAEYNFTVGFISDLNAKAIFLPYTDLRHGLLIILPNATASNLEETERRLFGLGYSPGDLLQAMSPLNVLLKLPKFQIKFHKAVTDSLKQMGFSELFSPHSDLSGISTSLNPMVPKEISVIHETVFDVDEGGTEAAGFKGVSATECIYLPPYDFTADHPFLFYLIDRENDSIPLLVGRFVNPLTN